MMKKISVICVFAVLLVSSPLTRAQVKQKDGGNSLIQSESNVVKDKVNKISGVDGTTSASQLRARKSHSVSKQDEIGLTVFFGLIILAVMVFFLKPFRARK